MDGNVLDADCQQWERGFTVSPDGQIASTPHSGANFYEAGKCFGYILGIVDSIPAGEGFDPDPRVRASQHIDVVLRYLRDNPELRHLPAHQLVRQALTDAFPKRSDPK